MRFASRLTDEQVSALKTTQVPLRSISFYESDGESERLLQEAVRFCFALL